MWWVCGTVCCWCVSAWLSSFGEEIVTVAVDVSTLGCRPFVKKFARNPTCAGSSRATALSAMPVLFFFGLAKDAGDLFCSHVPHPATTTIAAFRCPPTASIARACPLLPSFTRSLHGTVFAFTRDAPPQHGWRLGHVRAVLEKYITNLGPGSRQRERLEALLPDIEAPVPATATEGAAEVDGETADGGGSGGGTPPPPPPPPDDDQDDMDMLDEIESDGGGGGTPPPPPPSPAG